MATHSHHDIRQSLLSRIQSGEWPLGSLIPGEMQLAEDYGCARATVNRALRTLAEDGLVIRKRKGGTRIRANPVRAAKLTIPIIREQVEARGQSYTFKNLQTYEADPPPAIQERLRLTKTDNVLYVETLHFADDAVFALENRWLNQNAISQFGDLPDENGLSLNEWLVKTVPFSNGDMRFSAMQADAATATIMGVSLGEALFAIDRTTWSDEAFITTTQLLHAPGFDVYLQV
jgi:GntR family histidine utilization transcriptional repressor